MRRFLILAVLCVGSLAFGQYVPNPQANCMNYWNGTQYVCGTPSGATIPSGLITLILSGTCPSGWTEVSALNGKMLRGTVAANNDVGTTGGNATITPAGTVSQPTLAMNAYTPAGTVAAPTFTGSLGTVPAETFTGTANQATSATTAGTPAGTNGATATSGNCAATNIAAGTGSTTACKATAPNLTIPAETFTGSAMATHTHTLTPAGTNSTASFTPAGTNSAPAFAGTQATLTGTVSQPTFQGNAVDPSPSYVKVIFCSKN
jgi:hypothetical protein